MIERRVDHARRKRVSEMTPEEMREVLLVSEKTGLPNRRAFDEREPSPWFAMCDVNELKAMNGTYGYRTGDTLIQRLAEVLKELSLDAYHNQGDEFIVRGECFRDLDAKLSEAERRLSSNPFVIHSMHDVVVPIDGTVFSYGIGCALKEAETSLKHQKEIRKAGIREHAHPDRS
jgi:GGDEF domain-containing protein